MKMEVESPPGFGAGSDGDEAGSENRSISDLISELRLAFGSNLDRVEEILVRREEKLKKEAMKMEAKREFERCEKLQLEMELKKFRAEKRVLRESFEAMQERVKMADEKVKLGEEKFDMELKRLRAESEEQAKMSEERLERLMKEVKKEEREKMSEIVELREKNRELESAKAKGEDDLELWKGKFEEMEIRVSQLEGETAQLLKMESLVAMERDKASGEKSNGETGGFAVGSDSPSPSPAKGYKDLLSKGDGKSTSGHAIVILDSDDDCDPGSSSLYGKEFLQKLSGNKPIDLTGVETRPRVLKRKRSLSPSITNGSSVNNNSATEIPSTTNDAEKLKSPSNDDKVVLVDCEVKTGEERSSQSFIDKFSGDGINDLNFEVSSSSSDSDSDIHIDQIILLAKDQPN